MKKFPKWVPEEGSNFAYKDFLWNDSTVTKGDLKAFKLSHISPGAGFVYARSSWDEDATYFFFKCGDRFAGHQHMDVGNFLIYRHEQLVGDGGHYDSFSTSHCVNYYLRTIAHNTILVFDPDEKRDEYYTKKIGIRGGPVTGNDGGQHAAWPHHNGGTIDAKRWNDLREQVDIEQVEGSEKHQQEQQEDPDLNVEAPETPELHVTSPATRAESRRPRPVVRTAERQRPRARESTRMAACP